MQFIKKCLLQQHCFETTFEWQNDAMFEICCSVSGRLFQAAGATYIYECELVVDACIWVNKKDVEMRQKWDYGFRWIWSTAVTTTPTLQWRLIRNVRRVARWYAIRVFVCMHVCFWQVFLPCILLLLRSFSIEESHDTKFMMSGFLKRNPERKTANHIRS